MNKKLILGDYKNMRYKMIVTDMDDTLLNSEEKISRENKIAIMKAQKIGVKFVSSGMKDEATDAFIQRFVDLLKTSNITKDPITPVRPLYHKTQDEIYGLIKDDLLFPETVSCKFFPPCQTCAKCELRRTYGIN